MYYRRLSKKIGIISLLIFCGILIRIAIAASSDAEWPVASGSDVRMDGNLRLDCSNTYKGYVMMAVASPTGNAFKIQVMCGGNQLLYDINPYGDYEVLPLQFGPGNYSISLFENVAGSKYATGGKLDLSIPSMNDNAAFLVPNQYVSYTKDSPCVAMADQITEGMTSQTEIFNAICDYIGANFTYDFAKAQSVAAGTLPEVDSTFASRTGICQDLSAVTISMLRSQGIASRLIIGYVDGYYHAWTISTVDGEDKFFDPTAAVGALAVANNYTIERFY
ncbi:MAG: transglutaminase domain-containing protein [Blautia sp.]|nr:transglutaminase domain-containing protein [Blautia sp.]